MQLLITFGHWLFRAPNVEFIQGYGMTESAPMSFIAQRGTTNFATIGWPTPLTEAKIVKLDDGQFIGVDIGEVGELLVRSPSIMKGYLNNEAATAVTIVGDGWLRTGDIAYYDADGLFYITDRLKELIKVKGFQVAPAELEELIRDHPKVADVAVIGVQHPKCGEVPRAFVVRKKGADLTEPELQEYVAGKVAEYKRLVGGVRFIEVVPKSTTGKILRRELHRVA